MAMRIFQRCKNAMGWTVVDVDSTSDPDLIHHVTISELGYLCDCAGFQYRGSCRHKAIAAKNRCWWEEGQLPLQSIGEKQTKRCPNCGGETVLVAEVEDEDEA
jgi:hypothetical protein